MTKIIETIDQKIKDVDEKPNGWRADRDYLIHDLIDIESTAAVEDNDDIVDAVVRMVAAISVLPDAVSEWYKSDLVRIYTGLRSLSDIASERRKVLSDIFNKI